MASSDGSDMVRVGVCVCFFFYLFHSEYPNTHSRKVKNIFAGPPLFKCFHFTRTYLQFKVSSSDAQASSD